MILMHQSFEFTAENARGAHVPPGGAGAPAYASCREEPIFNFFTAPLPGGDLAGILNLNVTPHQCCVHLRDWRSVTHRESAVVATKRVGPGWSPDSEGASVA